MRLLEAAQLAVERPGPGVVVIRVAGDLDRHTVMRIIRLVDQQRELTRSRNPRVVVDLAEVRSFAEGALDPLCEAGARIAAAGGRLHVTGLAAREPVLPNRVADVIPRLATFPTLEVALERLSENN